MNKKKESKKKTEAKVLDALTNTGTKQSSIGSYMVRRMIADVERKMADGR